MAGSTVPGSTWSAHGLVAAGVGATLGAAASMAVAVPLASWASWRGS